MCSIEEAWAGQLFDGHQVQSQADLHRKYMPIGDNLLSHNNDFSACHREPQKRTKGMNTQNPSPTLTIQQQGTSTSTTSMGMGMSLNNNTLQTPSPTNSRINTLEKFAPISNNINNDNDNYNYNNNYNNNNNNNNDTYNNNYVNNNTLLNEDNDDDKVVIQKKFNTIQENAQVLTNSKYKTKNHTSPVNNNLNSNDNILQYQQFNNLLNIINKRLTKLEHDVHTTKNRNLYDMILFIIMGVLLAFIIHTIIRRKQ